MECASFFFFNDTATTEIYTLSLHDALPISRGVRDDLRGDHRPRLVDHVAAAVHVLRDPGVARLDQRADRKSTRLNSSHTVISYAVFCLKKKKSTLATSARRISDRRNQLYTQ